MSNSSYKYMLRYTCQPGHHVEEHLNEMVEFCRQAKIDDVMFFINGEQLNQGHLTFEETKPWMDVIAKGKRLLDDIGVTTSINPWPTLLHDDKGRTFRNGVKFNWMVDAYGHRSGSVACPICPDWRKYITEMYAYYASIEPYMLWVEDDFRHFNHGAELVWGGCFCDAHMEEFSRRAGKKLTRREFIEGILKKGEPHPYRKIWLETARDEMIENARLIGEAVHKVSPETRIGLMSSGPAVHCAEGRNWEGVLKGFAGDTPMANRPHLDAYLEVTAQEYLWRFNVISRVTRTFTPLETEIYPELENCADLRYTKSHKLMGLQLDTSLVLDAKGITLNIFDMMGNGVIMKEGLQNVLADRKDFLESIRGLGLSVDKQKGVKVLVDPEASFRLHTKHGKDIEELYPREYFWGGLLSSYGIPTVYSTEKRHRNSILAVSGQFFRNMSREEVTDLFKENFVLMEGEAAYTLFDMGYGHLAGISKAVWHTNESGYKSYAQVCDGRKYCGLADARLSTPYDYIEIEYSGNAMPKTEVKNQYNETVGAGMAVVNNRVFVLPYAVDWYGEGQWLLNPFREEIIKAVLKEAGQAENEDSFEQVIFTVDAPYVTPYHYEVDGKKVLVLVNSSNDDIEKLRIFAPGWESNGVVEMNRSHPEGLAADINSSGEYLDYLGGLKSMETKVLIWG